MDDIFNSHMGDGAGGTFLLAARGGEGGGGGAEELVGCVGALVRDRLTVELHRMSVSVTARRRGVGQLLIGALEVSTPHT